MRQKTDRTDASGPNIRSENPSLNNGGAFPISSSTRVSQRTSILRQPNAYHLDAERNRTNIDGVQCVRCYRERCAPHGLYHRLGHARC